MKRSVKSIIGFAMGAIDGDIGKVKEFFFDDQDWRVRYIVVETGSWLFGRKVLIAPQALLTPDWENKVFPVNLSKDQIKNSPNIDTEKPVSRQQELELYAHYPSWSGSWTGGIWAGGVGTTGMMTSSALPFEQAIHERNNIPGEEPGNPHLRSTDKLKGYTIKASDGDIGDAEDFIIDDINWKLSYMIVDTGNWLPGKKVLISPKWIKEMKWDTSEVIVKASVEQVKNSPEYHADKEITDSQELHLENYYGEFISH
jgi:hypothetical protein